MKNFLFIVGATIMIASCVNSKTESNVEEVDSIQDSVMVDSTIVVE